MIRGGFLTDGGTNQKINFNVKFLNKILNPSNRRVVKVINKNQAGFEIVTKE